MISPLSFAAAGLKSYARGLGVRGAMFASSHPVASLGLMGVGGLLAGAGAAKLVGGISPFGTSRGAPGRAVGGAILGGTLGVGAKYALGRFGGGRLANFASRKLGLYGMAAGALIGAAVGSNRGPNRIRGLF